MKKKEQEKLELNIEQKKVYDELHKHKPDLKLFMSCVPLPTKQAFIDFANKYFGSGTESRLPDGRVDCGHYGFALKYLWDYYQGDITAVSRMNDELITKMDSEIKKLKEEVKQIKEELKKWQK